MQYDHFVKINGRIVDVNSAVYFIADIASNHNGSLDRAKELIMLAKKAGADAVKFQHFLAEKIVSDYGFKNLGKQAGHQASWEKSVYEVFEEYECARPWTEELVKTCREAGIDFMTTPYDTEAVDLLDKYLPAYKIGSGDITWHSFLEYVALRNKPVLLATGASSMIETELAVECLLRHNPQIVLMQCNTNYTGSSENFKYINLNVLKSFAVRYPDMVLGLSDHTAGHSTVLGAVALGARVIEKHFTDNNSATGPDHAFSMNPQTWKEMVERTRELENALGTGVKIVEKNEEDTVILQRRSLRLKRDMKEGEALAEDDMEALRPAPEGSFSPYQISSLTGRKLNKAKQKGDAVYKYDIE